MTIEASALAFVAATKKRAQARTHLSALRKKWLDDNDTFFDTSESAGMEGYNDMQEALHDRETANAEYRRAKSRLFRACTVGVAACGNTPYDEGPFSIDHERTAFEAAMRAKHPEWAFTADPVFDYHNERTRCAWEGWQAARGVQEGTS